MSHDPTKTHLLPDAHQRPEGHLGILFQALAGAIVVVALLVVAVQVCWLQVHLNSAGPAPSGVVWRHVVTLVAACLGMCIATFILTLSRRINSCSSALAWSGEDLRRSLPIHEHLAEDYRELLAMRDALPDILWCADLTGAITYITPRCTEEFGGTVDDYLGWAWVLRVHPEEVDETVERWKASLETGLPFEAEFRVGRHPDVAYRWFLSRGTPMRDEAGRIVRWLGTTADIDAQHQARATLQESEERYRSLVQLLPNGVAMIDSKGYIMAANAQIGEILRQEPRALIGRSALMTSLRIIDHSGAELMPEDYPLARALKTGQPIRGVVTGICWPGDEKTWIMTSTHPLFRPGQAEPYAMICSLSDITERIEAEERVRQAHQELHAAHERLKELDTYKDEFLNTVSHELKGPLGIIMGFAGLLDEEVFGPLNEGQQECLVGMNEAAERLSTLVNDLLDIGAIKAGALRVYPQPNSLFDLVASALAAVGVMAEEHSISLFNELLRDLPMVFVDAQRTYQVLINLLTNAIKFTLGAGSITVRACLEGEWICCEVEDTGRGISPEELPQLFTRFTRFAASSLHSLRGSGLGLSISKALIEAQGGQIGVHSKPGEGSVFWFTLPLARE